LLGAFFVSVLLNPLYL